MENKSLYDNKEVVNKDFIRGKISAYTKILSIISNIETDENSVLIDIKNLIQVYLNAYSTFNLNASSISNEK